jgi:hypothetical protein
MAFVLDNLNNTSAGKGDAPKQWAYKSDTDAIGTIDDSGYFNTAAGYFRLGDLMYIKDSTDAVSQRTISSADGATPVTTIAYDYAGTVGTADIADGAVTAAKIAAAVAGAGLTGGAGTALAVQVDDSTLNIPVDTVQIKDLGVTAAKLVVSVPRTVTVAMSAAEFLGMYAAPKLLVAAGGANTLHVVHDVAYEVNFVSAQFANGGVVNVQYDSTVNGAGTAATATIAAATFNGFAADSTIGAAGALASSASTTTVNKGLYLSNATAAFITGDSTVNVHLTYSTVTTTV